MLLRVAFISIQTPWWWWLRLTGSVLHSVLIKQWEVSILRAWKKSVTVEMLSSLEAVRECLCPFNMLDFVSQLFDLCMYQSFYEGDH